MGVECSDVERPAAPVPYVLFVLLPPLNMAARGLWTRLPPLILPLLRLLSCDKAMDLSMCTLLLPLVRLPPGVVVFLESMERKSGDPARPTGDPR